MTKVSGILVFLSKKQEISITEVTYNDNIRNSTYSNVGNTIGTLHTIDCFIRTDLYLTVKEDVP